MPGSGHTLHRFKTTGHSTHSSFAYEDHDVSDYEAEPASPTASSTTNLIVRVDHSEAQSEAAVFSQPERDSSGEIEFSFVKPAPT